MTKPESSVPSSPAPSSTAPSSSAPAPGSTARKAGTARYEMGHLLFMGVTSLLVLVLLFAMPRMNADTPQLAGVFLSALILAVGWGRVWFLRRKAKPIADTAYWTVVPAVIVPVLLTIVSQLLGRRINIMTILAVFAVIAVVAWVQYDDWRNGRWPSK